MIKALNIEQARILVVDDHQVNLKLVEQTLASGGFEHCLVTQDPLSVEELLHQHSIDLVLLDINMPMLDGFGVLEIIRKFYHSTLQPPVIMVTAQDDADKRIKSLTLGASDYISKPFNREELIKRISVHLENWFMKKQLMAQNQVLDQKVKERTQELEKAHLEVVFRLGRAAEYRDNETGNHVKRVSLYAEALARKIGLDEQQCHLIKIASPMHDIGKIGVSDSIMLKPGKLTETEYLEMQKHVEIGGEILSGGTAPVLQYAYEIVMTHHEKYNGKGYPNGLAGEEIPVSGRIVAIVDVFDALTSSRPYKQAWTIEKAVDLLKKERGEHFDPYFVDCFIDILPEIHSISEMFHD